MTDKTILLLTYAENPSVGHAWLKGFLRHARTLNWRIETASFSGELEDRDQMIRTVRFFRPDGIVSASVRHSVRILLIADESCD